MSFRLDRIINKFDNLFDYNLSLLSHFYFILCICRDVCTLVRSTFAFYHLVVVRIANFNFCFYLSSSSSSFASFELFAPQANFPSVVWANESRRRTERCWRHNIAMFVRRKSARISTSPHANEPLADNARNIFILFLLLFGHSFSSSSVKIRKALLGAQPMRFIRFVFPRFRLIKLRALVRLNQSLILFAANLFFTRLRRWLSKNGGLSQLQLGHALTHIYTCCTHILFAIVIFIS